VGEIARIDRDQDGGATLTVRIPGELEPLVIQKGSIAIDGVSLTVAALDGPEVQIALIPHTLAATTFGVATVGDPVNIEVDMIGRYVARLMERSTR
jgi:riboflavin synthase